MSDLIRIKCGKLGNRAEMPALRYDSEKGGELGYRTDEKALYIGTNGGNVRLCGESDAVMLNNHEMAISTINNFIESIITRLDALENQSG